MIKNKQIYENLQYGFFDNIGKYNIPIIKPVNIDNLPELISFNYAKSTKDKADKGIHFFVDDYQFLRLWKNPSQYINLLKQFRVVFTPDFS